MSETSEVQEVMKQKRQLRHSKDNIKPSERPDPFKPPKTCYVERTNLSSLPISDHNCRNCIRKGSPFSAFNDWELQKISANWQFSSRVNSHNMSFSGYAPHKTIIEGYYKVTDSRFETNPGSSFCGGEVMDSSATSQRLMLTAQGTGGFGSGYGTRKINSRTKSFNVQSSTLSGQMSRSFYDTSRTQANELLGTKRPLVANQANVPTVKIASFSKRNPDTLFHLQG